MPIAQNNIGEVAMKKGFSNIDEEMTWEFFKMSNGNPYIIQDLVQTRNKQRALLSTKEK